MDNSVQKREVEFNEEMISKLIPKINYPVLVQTAKNIGIDVQSYPETLPTEWDGNTDFLKKVIFGTLFDKFLSLGS